MTVPVFQHSISPMLIGWSPGFLITGIRLYAKKSSKDVKDYTSCAEFLNNLSNGCT